METDAVPAAPAVSAGVLRDAMVDKLLRWGGVRTASVERALRVVPRHVFVPDVSLEQAYGSGSVVTHRDTDGTAISSASGPGVVAAMLEQLEVGPGHRVLEIGAGTGYNAACLAEMAGPGGQVTAVDIGTDIAAGARRGLDRAGYGSVRVVVGDGEYGHAERAPYDRVIVTAGAWDVPAAWKEQLAPGGRLVVPLRIRGVTRSVGLELHAGVWRSVSVEECGFMPVRGAGAVAERNVELLGDSGVRLRVDDGQPIDVDALGAALAVPAVLAWSGVVVPEKPFDHLDFWLAGTAAAAVCRVFVFDRALERGLARPIYPWGSMGLYTADSFAYLIRRPAGGAGEPMCEIGVCAYGPDADQLGGRAAAQVRAWGQAHETLAGLRVEVHPAGSADVPGAMMTVDKTSSRVFVSAIPA